MRGVNRFGLILLLMSVTACAPVVYDATYRSPTGRVSVQTTYTQPVYQHVNNYRKIHPIEVTLYADNSYRGVFFSPIRIVIANDQYVEIPVRDRRGRNTRIFAHYHQKNLHFDADRNCNGIHGATRYSYDKRWDKGHRYMSINAGRDYDLTGLSLRVRNASVSTKHQQVKKLKQTKIIKEKVVVKQKVVREKTHRVNSRAANVADRYANNQTGRSVKVKISKTKTPNRVNIKDVKAVKRPVIVEKINKHEQTSHVTGVNANRVGKKQVRGLVEKNVKIVERQNSGKSHKVSSVNETVNVSKKNNRRVSVKGERSDMTEQAEEYGKLEKIRGRKDQF